jgi:ATP-dependent Clp protease ATP-binding subunit ClpA
LVQHIHDPHDEDVARMLAICGLEPVEVILAAQDAERPSPPPLSASATRILQLAADDAARQGQDAVTSENLLIGAMRLRDGDSVQFLLGAGTDMPELHTRIGSRLWPDADPLTGGDLHRDAGAEAALASAIREADTRRREEVGTFHIWYGLVTQDGGPAVQLLQSVGTNIDMVVGRLRTGT